MRELIALVDTPTIRSLDCADPESFPGGIVFGLRREGDRPLDLPGFTPHGHVQEFPLPLPGEQPDRVMEFFDTVHARADKEIVHTWDCRRFAGFVALGTTLDISVLHVAEDTYDFTPTAAADLAPGLPYEAFCYGRPVHTTIGLGQGLSIGVPGLFSKIRIDNNAELANSYSANEYWGVRAREFKVSEFLLAQAKLLGAKTVEEAEKIILLEELRLAITERAKAETRSLHTERRRKVPGANSKIVARDLALTQNQEPDGTSLKGHYSISKRRKVVSDRRVLNPL